MVAVDVLLAYGFIAACILGGGYSLFSPELSAFRRAGVIDKDVGAEPPSDVERLAGRILGAIALAIGLAFLLIVVIPPR